MLSLRFNLFQMQSWYFTPFYLVFTTFMLVSLFVFFGTKMRRKIFFLHFLLLRRKICMKNIKYDYIDKNKIKNLWQYLSLLLQCKTILLLKIYRKNFFTANIFHILREKVISPWNVNITVAKVPLAKLHFLKFFFAFKMRAKQFFLQTRDSNIRWGLKMFDGNLFLLV